MEYTQKQLQVAFEMVQNENDWKAPIRKKIHVISPNLTIQCNIIREAIIHFTSTVPTFTTLEGGGILVTATGYRDGPCGDH